jgi:diguanylate cyclase (GGDEF)-like protein
MPDLPIPINKGAFGAIALQRPKVDDRKSVVEDRPPSQQTQNRSESESSDSFALAGAFAELRGSDALAKAHEILSRHGVRRFAVATVDGEAQKPVRYRYNRDLARPEPEALDPGTLAAALAAQEPAILASVSSLRRVASTGSSTLQHTMVCPVHAAGARVGFCVAQGENRFEPNDLALLESAAVLAGHQALLADESVRSDERARALRLLLETARVLSSEFDIATLFRKFHGQIARVMDATTFLGALLSEDGSRLELRYAAELDQSTTELIVIPPTSVSSVVARTGKAVINRHMEDWDQYPTIDILEGPPPASALFVPIKLGERVLGVFSVQSHRPEAYDQSHCDLLTAVSEQAAVAVDNARNLYASTQRAADLNLLVEVANAVSSELDLQRVFAQIHGQVKRVIDAPLFFAALETSERDSVRLEYLVEGDKVFEPQLLPTAGTIVGMVFESGKGVLVQDATERDRLTKRTIGQGPVTVESIVAAPMAIGGRTIGVLSVQSYEKQAYNDRHLKLLSAIAEQSAGAVQNARLYEQARDLADHDPLTGLLHHRAIQERVAIELKRAHRESTPLALVMLDVDNFKSFNDTYGHPVGDRVLRQVAESMRRVARESDTVGRYGGDEFCAILPGADHAAASAFVQRLGLDIAREPFRLEGRRPVPIALSAGFAIFPEDGDRREALLVAADDALYAGKRGDPSQPGGSSDSSHGLIGDFAPFDALVVAVANRNGYARAHQRLVNSLTARWAAREHSSPEERTLLLLASVLLDAGELALPSAIMRKPGALEEEEITLMHRHPALGFELIRPAGGYEHLAEIVRCHHERFDGTGYPRGLRGDSIPKAARIMSVIDAFSAMIGERPYRPARSKADAIAELRANAGSQFDPAVVDSFVEMVESAV